jgi:Flp pilus assembly protein TadG
MKRCKRGSSGRSEKESGATAIELVIWTPLLFLVMFTTVQFGLWIFARHVAISAAQEGARQARYNAYPDPNGWADSSKTYTSKWVTDLIGGLVVNGSLQVDAQPGRTINLQTTQNPEVGMSVSFQVFSVAPFSQLTVSATSVGPVECFYDDQGYCVGD